MTTGASRASFSLGRPFALDASEITVSKPCAPVRSVLFPSRNHRSQQDKSSATDPLREEELDLAEIIQGHRIALCDMVEPIARAL